VTYWPKIANFAHPLSYSALIRGDPFEFMKKSFTVPKTRSSRQPTVKIWWS